jgi:hypothetical protein
MSPMARKKKTATKKPPSAKAGAPPISPVTPKAVFLQGVAFEFSAMILEKQANKMLSSADAASQKGLPFDGSFFHAFMPSIVLSAFSIELYFKCLLMICTFRDSLMIPCQRPLLGVKSVAR